MRERNMKFRTSLYGKKTSLQLVLALAGREHAEEKSEVSSVSSSLGAGDATSSNSSSAMAPLTVSESDSLPVLGPAGFGESRKPNSLWRERKDVVQSGIVGVLSKQECKRQETIHEFFFSEDVFLNDVSILIKVGAR